MASKDFATPAAGIAAAAAVATTTTAATTTTLDRLFLDRVNTTSTIVARTSTRTLTLVVAG